MFLAVDIGNSEIKTGLFQKDQLLGKFNFDSSSEFDFDQYFEALLKFLRKNKLEHDNLTQAAISSVVRKLQDEISAGLKEKFSVTPLLISSELKLPLKIVYENPKQLGADRICNAVAGLLLYGAPVILIDFGTATTIEVVDENKNFIGGMILPGIKTSQLSLEKNTANLKEASFQKPDRVIANSTSESLRSGHFYGTVGQITFAINAVKDELQNDKVKIIATGGLAETVSEYIVEIDETNLNLTLEGIRIILESNS